MMQVVDARERFGEIYESTYAAVRRYAYHRGLSGADADDLVAETFTVAWRRLESVPPDDPLPWLFAVARNHWRNHLRRNRRDRDLIDRLGPPEPSAPVTDEPSVLEIRTAMATLSENDREILQLVAWDGLTPTQAAGSLGCSAGAARVKLHRARNRLAEALGETFSLQRTELGHTRRTQEVRDGT
jgi:RNA polymerase sigma-70 factor (ECF subfamily)